MAHKDDPDAHAIESVLDFIGAEVGLQEPCDHARPQRRSFCSMLRNHWRSSHSSEIECHLSDGCNPSAS